MKKSYFKRKHKRSLAEIVIAATLFILCAVVTRVGILPDLS